MSAIDQLDTIINSDKWWANQRAEAAKAIYQQYQKGNLTDSEYKELLKDVIQTRELDKDADDTELRSNLVSAINGLIGIFY